MNSLVSSAGSSSMAMDLTLDSSFTIGDGSSLISVFDIMLLFVVGRSGQRDNKEWKDG